MATQRASGRLSSRRSRRAARTWSRGVILAISPDHRADELVLRRTAASGIAWTTSLIALTPPHLSASFGADVAEPRIRMWVRDHATSGGRHAGMPTDADQRDRIVRRARRHRGRPCAIARSLIEVGHERGWRRRGRTGPPDRRTPCRARPSRGSAATRRRDPSARCRARTRRARDCPMAASPSRARRRCRFFALS